MSWEILNVAKYSINKKNTFSSLTAKVHSYITDGLKFRGKFAKDFENLASFMVQRGPVRGLLLLVLLWLTLLFYQNRALHL